MTDETSTPHIDENHLNAERRAKLTALRTQGVAFPNDFRRADYAGDLQAHYIDAERWSGEIHVATATVDEACIAPLEELMRVRHKMSYEHVWFSDRAKCLHDLQAWADGPKRGGLTGIDPLATSRT